MDRTIAMALGLMVAAGCSARQRAEKHEEKAAEQVQEAREARANAEQKAREELQKAQEERAKAGEKAQEQMKDVLDERTKAEKNVAGEMEDVREATAKGNEKVRAHIEEANAERRKGEEKAQEALGKARDEKNQAREELNTARTADEMAAGTAAAPPVGREIKDKLGDDWTVQRQGASWLATRKKMSQANRDIGQKLDQEVTELRKDKPMATATYARDKVMLRGRIDDCGDISKVVDDFAKIEGVNRIVAEVTCATTGK